MSISQDQLELAQGNLRDAFFALAFDSGSVEAAAKADEALAELDRLLDPASPTDSAPTSSASTSSGPAGSGPAARP